MKYIKYLFELTQKNIYSASKTDPKFIIASFNHLS